jgi:branched-chain amino acid transport system substrate-binding protein
MLLAFCLISAAAAGPKPISIGAALPLSGPEAKSGARVRDGYELAIEIANQGGGVELAGRRTPVKLVITDDRSEGATDAKAVEELVRGGAAAILGTFGSSLVEYGSAAAEKLQVPYVAPTGASRALYQRGFKYLFGLQTPVEQMANATLRWIEDEQQRGKLPSPLRIVLLAEKTPHGKEYATGVKDFVEKTPRRRGAYQIVLEESFDLNVKDVRPLLERVKGARADVLLVDAHLPDYLTFHSQYAKMDMCHKVISYGARGPEHEARDQLKAAVDYVLSAVWWSAQMGRTERVAEFIAKFDARYRREPEWYEALGYEAARTLLEAMHNAGSTEPNAVRRALEQLKMESILPGGYLAFPEQYGRQAWYLFLVQQNMPDGTAPVIFPRIAAVKDGVAPNPRCAQAKVAK